MNFVSRRGFILGTILLLLISNINRSDAIRRRRQINNDSHNDLSLETLIADIRKVPLIGPGLSYGLDHLSMTIYTIDELLNGAISRVAGVYLPCVIDAEGVQCNGKMKGSGVEAITKDIVDHSMLPDFAKNIIKKFLDTAIFPTFNAIVGIPVSNKKT